MGHLSVFNPSRQLISSFSTFFFFSFYYLLLLLFFHTCFLFSFSFFLFFPFFPFFCRYGCLKSSVNFTLLLFLLVNTYLSTIVTVGPSMLKWTLMSSLSLWSVLMLQTSNGWWNGGTSQAWLTVALRTTVFLWQDFAIALTTPHVTLPDNLLTAKGLLMMMALSIPWSLLIGLWVGSVRLGHNRGWLETFVLLRVRENKERREYKTIQLYRK